MARAWVVSAACALALTAPAAAQQTDVGHVHAQTAESAELERQLEQLRLATERYRNHENAVADGFKRFGADGPLMGEHWYHPDRVKAELDLASPSTLQYAWIGEKRELVGVAYTLYRRPTDPMPEGFTGDEDHWHVHDLSKVARAIASERPFARFLVDAGIRRGRVGAGDGRTHLTMVHAWPWLDNPDGPFAQRHRALPYLRAGFPASYASSGNEDAAWGVSLLMPGTCRGEVQRVNALAHLTTDQRSRLGAACATAEAEVHAVMRPTIPAETLNATASSAWRRYREAQAALLTAEQKERLAATIEHEHVMGGG
jgi:hypothetical protein